MTTEHHVMELEQHFLVEGVTAWCSCGWSGRRRDSGREAVEDFDNHCEAVFMEATMVGGFSDRTEGDGK